ncbi:Cof-type HAD-IIB family hydrolase [Flagellimonas sp. HMM57]|uniref:Cof-type HAD-IIB family hydrolase n=1 Tax=unclassified Flagellimonas TaxID=2644544 RepID=UPI0013D13D9E|nr:MULTISPECIES: Cof-type HAD-IIB family hydrolase [unclassified Flagellimonas]UII76585.1 Cof-type HAD-IIB family hydrolase [Flagellimonas sp. HMM57]
MNFKVLCSDLDGTLLSTKNDVSEFTISEINRIKNKLKIILVSARMPKSMTYLQQRMGIQDNPIICYNGALVMSGTKELSSTSIPTENIDELYDRCKCYNIKLGLYHKDEWCVSENSERVEKEIFNTRAEPIFEPTEKTLERWRENNSGPHKIMLMGTKENMDDITLVLTNKFSSVLNHYRSNDTLIEVAPRTTSKLKAIATLLEPKTTLKEVIAFGDNYNDIEMLKNVGYGVAVSNARNEAKQIADAITLTNKENGVAQFIKDHL